MIRLVTGPPGTGKSYYCVRQLVFAAEAGKIVATNVSLSDNFVEYVLSRRWGARFSKARQTRLRRELLARVFVSDDLEELFKLRLRGTKEGRGYMVLDEAHNWLNARTWDSDETGKSQGKTEAVRRRLAVVRFFSQHRKLGWNVDLVSQDEANLDRQVRTLYEHHTHLKNARAYKPAGIRVFPFNLFFAVTLWNDPAKSRVGTSAYLLNKRLARLYDTHSLSHGLVMDDPDAIWLPREASCAAKPADAPASPSAGAPDPRSSAGVEAVRPVSVDRTSPYASARAPFRSAPPAPRPVAHLTSDPSPMQLVPSAAPVTLRALPTNAPQRRTGPVAAGPAPITDAIPPRHDLPRE